MLALAGCGHSRPAPSALRIRSPSARLLVRVPIDPGPAWRPEATVRGRPAAWIARRSAVTLLRFDQRLVHLALHAGTQDPGGRGWTYGARIGRRELQDVVAAFNGGFRFSYGRVGFLADRRLAVPLTSGLASIVTYRDGGTAIGAWHAGVPAPGRPIASVLQNLTLLVDRRRPAPNLATCVQRCWGATVGYLDSVARSALGIDATGRLVWAAGEHLTPAAIARELISAGAVRALELDINPQLVGGYVYVHRRGGRVIAVPVIPAEPGIPGAFLKAYSRDFLTVLAGRR